MRHRGVHVGNFFLADKAGGQEFTKEDEEVLVLFASQAATAIANARTYRREQRARAGLEALVETSPVGVVVLDARTGRPVSLNREAKRIVGGLRSPGGSTEDLLGVVACRRADGREVSLEEFPVAQQLSSAETVAPRRSSSPSPTAGASGPSSTSPRSVPRTAASNRSSSPCRTWPSSRSWSGCGPSSWPWSATSCGRR